MDFATTLGLMLACLAVGLFAAWRGARPPNPHKGPRLAPWRFIMVLGLAAAMYLAAHLLNLLGVQTGNNR